MRPDTHDQRAAQKTQAHKAGEFDPQPGTVKRKERRQSDARYFNPDAHKCWMFPANRHKHG